MNKLKKALLTPLSIILLSGGWFLEVYYYQFRFTGDGTPFIISIIIASTLTLFLTSLFINTNKKKVVIRSVLIVFSMFYTISGQNYSYNKSQNINSVKNNSIQSEESKYNDYTVRIQELDKTIQQKNSLLPDNIKDRTYLNKNGVQPLLNEIQELKKERKEYETLRDNIDMTGSNIVNKSAYEMLADDMGLTSPTPLKLISQALLSLFIALMAPSGIKILESLYTPKKEVKKVKKVVATADELTTFSDSRFFNQENPKALKSRASVVKETGISYDQFNKYRKLEIKLNVTKKESGVIIPSVSRSKYIMLMRNKSLYTSGLQAVQG